MDQKGFIGALFDFSFSEFVTTKIIKFLYGLFLILIALGTLFGLFMALFTMFRTSFLLGFFQLILVPILALIYLILARAWTEIIIVLFRIAENTTTLVRQGGLPRGGGSASAAPAPPPVPGA